MVTSRLLGSDLLLFSFSVLSSVPNSVLCRVLEWSEESVLQLIFGVGKATFLNLDSAAMGWVQQGLSCVPVVLWSGVVVVAFVVAELLLLTLCAEVPGWSELPCRISRFGNALLCFPVCMRIRCSLPRIRSGEGLML